MATGWVIWRSAGAFTGREANKQWTKPRCSFRQQAPAGLNKDLSACDDVVVAGVCAPVMTDAADRGHKQHASGHDSGENLGVVTGAAGHPDGTAAGKGDARSFDCTLECCIHHGGGAGTDTLHRDNAAALCADLCGRAPQEIPHATSSLRG